MSDPERVPGRALPLGMGVAIGGFLGAVVGASLAVVESCEPDYPMLCELAGLLGGALGLAIGAILAGAVVGVALRGALLKRASVVGAVIILGAGLVLLKIRMSYPQAFRNVLVQNRDIWVVPSVVLGLVVGVIALLLDRRRPTRWREG